MDAFIAYLVGKIYISAYSLDSPTLKKFIT